MGTIVKLVISVLFCELVGILGAFVTTPSIKSWYSLLTKPPFNPPNWIFAPVWTTLFLMMGIALFLVWNSGFGFNDKKIAIIIFFTQLALNFLWSYFFFGLHLPFVALIDIIFLFAAIALTITKFLPISKTAAYLLIPYLVWVGFASLLNLYIVKLN